MPRGVLVIIQVMKKAVSILAIGALVSGCVEPGGLFGGGGKKPGTITVIDETASEDVVETAALAPETTAPPPPAGAQSVDALDTTTAEQRAAATAPAASAGKVLGKTIASLGSATEPGLWLKTPLVTEKTEGRVTNLSNGKSSLVTLIPIDGPKTAGSRMSLSALRLIEGSLADLTEVEVSLEG